MRKTKDLEGYGIEVDRHSVTDVMYVEDLKKYRADNTLPQEFPLLKFYKDVAKKLDIVPNEVDVVNVVVTVKTGAVLEDLVRDYFHRMYPRHQYTEKKAETEIAYNILNYGPVTTKSKWALDNHIYIRSH